jgi:outer membrane protein assembly factor BamD
MDSLRTLPRLAVLLLTVLPLLAGCGGGSKDDDRSPTIGSVAPVEDLYNNGIDALNAQRYESATDQFSLVEQNYPYSSWAVNAQLMQGYTQYLRNRYTEAIGQLDRFIQLHPTHRDVAYAYYLRALSYYEQIADIQYESQHLYEAALGRFQRVVDDYQTTNHVPEALHRLTEIYLILGLRDEARKTAAVLGYNYPGSAWYEDSYNNLFDSGLVQQPGPQRPPERGFFSRAWHSVF